MFQPRTILLPVDLDENGLDALPYAVDFAKQFGASLHLLYVNTPQAGYRHASVLQEDLEARIRAHASAASMQDMQVECVVSRGDLGEETRRYCAEHAVDLLITTHERHGRFYSSFLDTRDEEIIESVDVPVLVLSKEFLT
jgi:nucleotide-binding universal stress UspA family protein